MSMPMACLNVGFIQPSIEPVSVRMKLVVAGRSASLLTNMKICGRCMLPQAQPYLLQGLSQLVQ